MTYGCAKSLSPTTGNPDAKYGVLAGTGRKTDVGEQEVRVDEVLDTAKRAKGANRSCGSTDTPEIE